MSQFPSARMKIKLQTLLLLSRVNIDGLWWRFTTYELQEHMILRLQIENIKHTVTSVDV